MTRYFHIVTNIHTKSLAHLLTYMLWIKLERNIDKIPSFSKIFPWNYQSLISRHVGCKADYFKLSLNWKVDDTIQLDWETGGVTRSFRDHRICWQTTVWPFKLAGRKAGQAKLWYQLSNRQNIAFPIEIALETSGPHRLDLDLLLVLP